MNLILHHNQLSWGSRIFPCSWGHGGIKNLKEEGDGATPVGSFPFRRVFFRADRIEKPETLLPLQALTQQDGWCDDLNDECYNQHVTLPYKGRHEKLWREDHVYDLILVVGHNDNPIEVGKGSAIFVHVRRPEGTPTEGCVALELQDLLKVIKEVTQKSSLVVHSH
jgi:L,D-peptidoglycan transpeptidase YkuD (ErfK/YbiS/YcfS/YnhG family)